MEAFRAAAAGFMNRRFGCHVDPQTEVIGVIGSKEAIAHFPFAFVNPGDVVLCPDPGYPVYATLTRFAGGEPYFLPLRRENGFLPDLDAIPADVARRAKILWINYPNNPTAALAAPGLLRGGGRVRREERRHRRQRPRLQRDVLRGAAARRSWRRRARATSASSSTRCRRPTT